MPGRARTPVTLLRRTRSRGSADPSRGGSCCSLIADTECTHIGLEHRPGLKAPAAACEHRVRRLGHLAAARLGAAGRAPLSSGTSLDYSARRAQLRDRVSICPVTGRLDWRLRMPAVGAGTARDNDLLRGRPLADTR